jgi:2-methylaconitate cis-trans-isomerase PrpF
MTQLSLRIRANDLHVQQQRFSVMLSTGTEHRALRGLHTIAIATAAHLQETSAVVLA